MQLFRKSDLPLVHRAWTRINSLRFFFFPAGKEENTGSMYRSRWRTLKFVLFGLSREEEHIAMEEWRLDRIHKARAKGERAVQGSGIFLFPSPGAPAQESEDDN